ncbi:MAG: hypothetical protein WC506_04615 [Candidatus Micrarchaeia archaeon]
MARMKNEISACMKCGSKDLEANPGAEFLGYTAVGLSGAMSGQVLCKKCGYFGYPIAFGSEKARAAYEKSKTKSLE